MWSLTRRPRAGAPLQSRPTLARSATFTALAALGTTIIGAAQSFLLVFFVGPGPATDGFLAVYSIYVAVALVGTSLRRSVVPLLGPANGDERQFRHRANELLRRISATAAVATLALALTSPFTAMLLTRGLPADTYRTAFAALVILSPAAFLQIRAGAMSGVLNALRRFPASAGLYVMAGLTGLGASAVFLQMMGAIGAAVGILTSAVVLAASHGVYGRRLGFRPSAPWRSLIRRRQLTLATLLLSGTTISLAQQLALVISLAALAGTASPGGITEYSYAYFLMLVTTNLSSYPVTIVSLPDAVDSVARRGASAAKALVVRQATYSLAVLAPLLAGFIGFGRVALDVVFLPVMSAASIDRIYTLGLILMLVPLGHTLFTVAGSMLIVLGHRLRVAAVAGFGLSVHAALAFAAAPHGTSAVAWAHGSALGAMVGAAMVAVFAREALGIMVRIVLRAMPMLALSGLYVLVGRSIDGPLWWTALVVVLCTTAYVGCVGLLWLFLHRRA